MFRPRLDVLPAPQAALWPRLAQIPEHYVLYGGTAIALRLGHRASVDFDFFFDLSDVARQELLSGIPWLAGATILQTERDTLTVSIDVAGDPIKVSFFGGMAIGCVREPEETDDRVMCVASLDDLFAHKLKVIRDRAEGKDYQDIAEMLMNGQRLERGLAAKEALFGSSVPAMVTLKALTYFADINEAWRLTAEMRSVIVEAVRDLPRTWEPAVTASTTLVAGCGRPRSGMSGRA